MCALIRTYKSSGKVAKKMGCKCPILRAILGLATETNYKLSGASSKEGVECARLWASAAMLRKESAAVRFTLKRTPVNERRPPLIKQRGKVIKRRNPKGWAASIAVVSVWIYSSKPEISPLFVTVWCGDLAAIIFVPGPGPHQPPHTAPARPTMF
jgi:hypothetical protein